jgi:hypothetical protein
MLDQSNLSTQRCRWIFWVECSVGGYLVLAKTITGVFFKFGVEVGVELSIVNALYRLRITDQRLNLTFLHEWCDLNRLSNPYFDAKFQKTPFITKRP